MTEQAENKDNARTSDWRAFLFTYRSYTPIPFLVIMLFFARPTVGSLIFGFIVAASGELIRFWGVSYAGSETRTTGAVGGTQLVTSGPYGHVRNPLYVGNILMYLGIGIMSDALMPYLQIAALIYFMIQYSAIVSLEEEYLSRTFSNWKEYKTNVGRFIPKFSRFNGGAKLSPDLPRALRSERSSLIALISISLVLCIVYILRGAA